ncbi:MAG: N-acetyltransferase, partial [Psychromonas sp.]|nr:N-acetyltransferase [Psychromonas sp.]
MLTIRDEKSEDYQQIELITDLAFKGKPYSAGNEATIPQKLRDFNAVTFALVAEYKGDIVAHIAISTVQVNAKNQATFAIGPLSVSPEFQGKGIGSKLVKMALTRL